jgi:hypothetical protein
LKLRRHHFAALPEADLVSTTNPTVSHTPA